MNTLPILFAGILLTVAGRYGETNAQTLRTLYQFGSTATDGQQPDAAPVQGSEGNFYGTSAGGMNLDGVVFHLLVPLSPLANQISAAHVPGTNVAISIPRCYFRVFKKDLSGARASVH
jgi:hypothetical protein